ncbi:hypothetical protein GCM10028790_03190 [Micromonospora taraxaci]|uniref:Uncharacterized protein n=1 Tax=Micromonospora taraxaci TaxID=1316803 RepID=A0A561W684_9ACTN|nr:hypothetical protein FHU34_114753 [Micromonospora taraxaci]
MCLRGAVATEGTRSGNVPAILAHSCSGRSAARGMGMTGLISCFHREAGPAGRSVEVRFSPKAEFVDHVGSESRMWLPVPGRVGLREMPASSGTRGPFLGRVDPTLSSTGADRMCGDGHVITVRDRRFHLPSLG